jgi:hypothetical protein
MATFVRGVSGIIEEIESQRRRAEEDRLRAENGRRSRGGKRPNPTELRREGEVNGLITLLSYLKTATIMSEEDFDNRFKIGGYGSPGESAFAVAES